MRLLFTVYALFFSSQTICVYSFILKLDVSTYNA